MERPMGGLAARITCRSFAIEAGGEGRGYSFVPTRVTTELFHVSAVSVGQEFETRASGWKRVREPPGREHALGLRAHGC